MLSRMMRIDTAHFGCLSVNVRDVLCFPAGLAGLELRHRWVLLTPPGDTLVRWLQAIDCPKTALGVVDPECFVPDYQLRVCRRELARLELGSMDEVHVLVTLNRTERGLALDLRAPLVINRKRRIGRQVICNDDMPVRYPVEGAALRAVKKTA